MIQPQNYDKLNSLQRKALRERYVREQGFLCHYCGESFLHRPKETLPINWSLFPPNFTKHPIHLHHHHDTGMTIGAVHAYCNAVLWQYHQE